MTDTDRLPRYFPICAWAVPIMVVGQFSMIALAPLLVLVIASVADRRTRSLRPWTLALGIAYAVPLTVKLVREDPAPSLSKDMHPVLFAAIVVAGAALLIRMYLPRYRMRFNPRAVSDGGTRQ